MSFTSVVSANLQIRLLSLLFAVLLWLTGTLETNGEITVPLSVNYVHIPEGLSRKAEPDVRISISLEGPRVLLVRQKILGVSLDLELSEAKKGLSVYSGIERHIRLIHGVKMVGLSHHEVLVILESHR